MRRIFKEGWKNAKFGRKSSRRREPNTKKNLEKVGNCFFQRNQTKNLDPRDRWVLECWLALVQELEFLVWREQTLKLRAKDMQLADECKKLDEEYRNAQELEVDDELKVKLTLFGKLKMQVFETSKCLLLGARTGPPVQSYERKSQYSGRDGGLQERSEASEAEH